MSIPGQLNPSARLLLGPGPSNVHPRVLTAMATPLLGHLDPEFLVMMNEVQGMLRQVLKTKNQLTFPVSATGMGGMEACVVNLIEPGDKMVVCVKGFFGQRIAEIGTRAGARVTVLEKPWGEVFDLDEIRAILGKVRPKVLAIVHAETTTGAWQPLEQVADLCHEFDAMLLVDAVTSVGCIPFHMDGWNIDAMYSCTQKGLSCPPGMSPVSFSTRALDVIRNRKSKVQSWYFDMSLVCKYWGEDRFYHHTAPITMTYAVREGLRLILEEGLEARWQRHMHNHRAIKAGLTAMGLKYSAADGHQLPQLNAVYVPAGVDELAVRKKLITDFGIEIGGGLGDFKGKVWRIGIMGYNSSTDNVLLLLSALEQCLLSQGVKVEAGAGVAAANAVYANEQV